MRLAGQNCLVSCCPHGVGENDEMTQNRPLVALLVVVSFDQFPKPTMNHVHTEFLLLDGGSEVDDATQLRPLVLEIRESPFDTSHKVEASG